MGVRTWLGLTGLALLAGCGGGGGGVDSTGTPPSDASNPVVSTPTPVSSTPTTTATTPVTINYNDAEYGRSNASSFAGAVTAYNAGATGNGIKLAVVDSGLAAVGSEFSGRIDPASRDFGSNGTYVDASGHGTAVAAVAAAARDGSNIEGVAFNATILALRADTAGSCAASTGCSFSTTTLATALDYARTNGAKIVNMSLGGAAATPTLTAAIDRATAAGIVVVIAAGNDATDQPDPLAQVAGNAVARGLVVIAGAHDSAGSLSTFSAKAGSFARFYLAALGTRVRSFDNNGVSYLYSGTSFSTPTIAGAVALLEQAFPNLTPAQVLSLLYSSATDAGVSGIDSTYGNGLLNIARAFRPVGTTGLAGSAIPVTGEETSLLSGAMGDAALQGAAQGSVVVLDSLGRAFDMPLPSQTARVSLTRPLQQAFGAHFSSGSSHMGGVTMSSTVARGFVNEPAAGLAQAGRGYRPVGWAMPVDGSLVAQLGGRTRAGVTYATGSRALGERLGDDDALGSFLAARAPGDSPGFVTARSTSFAVKHRLGSLAFTASVEGGTVALPRAFAQTPSTYVVTTINAERRLGTLRVKAGLGAVDERGTLVGARLSPLLGQLGGVTRFVDLDATLDLGSGWQARVAWRGGRTDARRSGLLDRARLATSAAAVDLGRQANGRRFGIRVSSPARVTGGSLDLMLPTSYDYDTAVVGYSSARLALVPRGRERDIEMDAGLNVGRGWLESNVFLRHEPGNIAAAPDDLGAALRLSLAW